MKNILITTLLLFASILSVGCHKDAQDRNCINFEEFKNPTAEYRASLFYSLNDSLYPDLIRKQIKEFAKGGIGGVFFHAREGLLTQYWGNDWWEAIDAGVNQCVKSGVNPWFYDEYKWPSGYAGGYVPRKSEEFRGHYLARISKNAPIPENGVLVSSDSIYNYVCMTAEFGNLWLNGTCKVDYLNPTAIREFVAHTYQTYADRNKQKYNHAVKGIFFDEPDIQPETNGKRYDGVISYSPAFRETFNEVKGYDIADYFSSLFEEKGDFRKIRLDFWQIAAMQYEKSFAGQLGDFCNRNGLTLTGHFFPEETLSGCQTGIGNLMRQLRNEGMPGMDHLELRVAGGLNVAKSVSSVGNQYGKERRMSELFGVSGQNMNFEDQKWIANWHIVLGVNFFVEHLALYSMRGERKRDYPPVLSYQQPWWEQYRYIQDYMGRLCYLSTIGEYAAKTLLLVPLESMYIAVQEERTKLEKDYYSTMENMMKVHCDFDLGDEQIIEEIGYNEKGVLKIGEMEYNTIVIPELLTLRNSTIQKLLDFARSGGKILILNGYPRYVDAEENTLLLDELKQLSTLLVNDSNTLKENLDVLTVSHTMDAEIYTQKRTTPMGNMYMFTNISRKKTEKVTYTINGDEKNPVVWNPSTVKTYKAVPDNAGNIELELEPAGFLILTTGGLSESSNASDIYRLSGKMHPCAVLEQYWQGHKLSPNALTLDFATYSINGSTISTQPEPLIAIMRRMSGKRENIPMQLQFKVNIEDIPENCELVVERPQMYSDISVNGREVTGFGDAYYRDVFFLKSQNIAPLLQKGNNTIQLSLNFIAPNPTDTMNAHRYGTELESIYLIGDFAVRAASQTLNQWDTEKNATQTFIAKPVHRLNQFSLVKEPEVFSGDIATEGYPFYAGQFVLSNSFELQKRDAGKRYYINIPLAEAVVYELRFNGKQLEPRMASPFVWDVTDFIVEGKNMLEFTLTNSLRNLLGPHHHKGGELKGVSALSFVGTGGWPHGEGDSDWHNLRLDKHNELRIWTDDYYMIPFGFIDPVQVCISTE